MKQPQKIDSWPWLSLIGFLFSNGYVSGVCSTFSGWIYGSFVLVSIGMVRLAIVAPMEVRGMTQSSLSWLLADGVGRALIGFSGSILIPALFLSRFIRALNILIEVLLLTWAIIFMITALHSLCKISLYCQNRYSEYHHFLIILLLTIVSISVFPILRSLYCLNNQCGLGYVDF